MPGLRRYFGPVQQQLLVFLVRPRGLLPVQRVGLGQAFAEEEHWRAWPLTPTLSQEGRGSEGTARRFLGSRQARRLSAVPEQEAVRVERRHAAQVGVEHERAGRKLP